MDGVSKDRRLRYSDAQPRWYEILGIALSVAVNIQLLPAMANNHPLNGKCKVAGSGSLRITPSNSPFLRPSTRSPNKPPAHQSTLALQTVIGTTTTSPNGFACHDQSRSFAFCAGSAAVLAELDDDANVSQRFFRARPSATSVNPVTSFYSQSTPPSTPDAKTRPIPNLRSSTPASAHSGSPSSDLAESHSPRGWSSRERIKAVTSVSISPNGRFLACGEVSGGGTISTCARTLRNC